MPTRLLPASPNLDHLKYQAKDLLRLHALKDAASARTLQEFHPRLGIADDDIFTHKLTLADAQLTIARQYGFSSWDRLKRHIEKPGVADDLSRPHHERIEEPVFRAAVAMIDAGDALALRRILQEQQGLIRERVRFEGGNYFRNPGLLEFVAENPVRNGRLPQNIVQIASILLEAGAEAMSIQETLGLVASGRVARDCNVQLELIELLCRHGADPNLALAAAMLHGEMAAVAQLIRSGARADLVVLAATGDFEGFVLELSRSDAAQRRFALALAAQFGHAEIVRALLDAGVDPNVYGPGHSHATPLHQAALAGHMEIVRMLAERGARLDAKDTMWGGTPADWAAHGGHGAVEDWLRQMEQA